MYVCVHTPSNYYSVWIRNEILIYATTWNNLKDITLSEIKQTQKDEYFKNTLYRVSKSQILEIGRVNSGYHGLGRGENRGLLFNEYRVSLWDDEKFLEMNGGKSSIII